MTRFSSLFFALILLLGGTQTAHALQPAHLNYKGCDTCHALHGSPGGFLLDATGGQATCEACHGVDGVATEAANHTPPGYTIECRGCHDAHEYVGTPNEKMIGYKCDPATMYGCDNGPAMTGTPPVIRVQNATSDINNPVYVTVQFYNSATDFNIAGSAVGVCEVCHSGNHNEGQDCTSCHSHATGFQPSGCDSAGCHDGNGSGGLAVGPNSPHSSNTTPYGCSVCHGGHGAGTIIVPNNSNVGINYTADSRTGINLGSSSAPGDTEAEICWNCHDDPLNGVSEWGVNSDTNGLSFPNYDFGSLSSSAWVNAAGTSGATWTSANFSYKTAAIQSTHSVNPYNSATAPGLDPVAFIRCSYCHDVHDTFGGPNDGNPPYLRGTWVGNPYREDGAPRNDSPGTLPGDVADYSTYDVTDKFGAVPRGGTAYTALGGYYIDQNSGSPTSDASMDSPDEFAGICILCHEGTAGTADGNWQSAEIDSLNKFDSPGTHWVSNSNSHARIVKGGSGSSADNLFTMAKRFPTTSWSEYSGDGSNGGEGVMAYQNAYAYNSKRGIWESVWGQGLRGTDTTAFQYSPQVDTSGRGFNYTFYDWGATVVTLGSGTMADSGTDANFHQFTCSKCHNPHASRLPRLLITNCLDTNHNTWDDSYVTPASDTNGSSSSLVSENQSVPMSQVTSAQNCHRLADPQYNGTSGPQGTTTGGWNRVTPWQEF